MARKSQGKPLDKSPSIPELDISYPWPEKGHIEADENVCGVAQRRRSRLVLRARTLVGRGGLGHIELLLRARTSDSS
jgi:hypothetical protein